MNANEEYKRADVLYREDRFEEALVILDALDQAHPGQRNIMFPRARCLTKLARDHEALEVCEELIKNFDLEKARELRSLILTQKTNILPQAPEGQVPQQMPGVEAVKTLQDPQGTTDSIATQETTLSKARLDEDYKDKSPWTKTVIVSVIVVLTITASYIALFGLSE